jgi:hypothetical protein
MAGDSQDAPRHAGQVVRRVLLRRNIATDTDTDTAQLVTAAVQASYIVARIDPRTGVKRRIRGWSWR